MAIGMTKAATCCSHPYARNEYERLINPGKTKQTVQSTKQSARFFTKRFLKYDHAVADLGETPAPLMGEHFKA